MSKRNRLDKTLFWIFLITQGTTCSSGAATVHTHQERLRVQYDYWTHTHTHTFHWYTWTPVRRPAHREQADVAKPQVFLMIPHVSSSLHPAPFPVHPLSSPLLPLLTSGHVAPTTHSLISTCLVFLPSWPELFLPSGIFFLFKFINAVALASL